MPAEHADQVALRGCDQQCRLARQIGQQVLEQVGHHVRIGQHRRAELRIAGDRAKRPAHIAADIPHGLCHRAPCRPGRRRQHSARLSPSSRPCPTTRSQKLQCRYDGVRAQGDDAPLAGPVTRADDQLSRPCSGASILYVRCIGASAASLEDSDDNSTCVSHNDNSLRECPAASGPRTRVRPGGRAGQALPSPRSPGQVSDRHRRQLAEERARRQAGRRRRSGVRRRQRRAPLSRSPARCRSASTT